MKRTDIKQFLRWFILSYSFFALILGASTSFAKEIELVEITSEPAEGLTYTVEKNLGKVEYFEIDNEITIQVNSKRSFKIQKFRDDVDMEAFYDMSLDMQKKFLSKRIYFLTRIAQVLNFTRFAVGSGMVMGNKATAAFTDLGNLAKTLKSKLSKDDKIPVQLEFEEIKKFQEALNEEAEKKNKNVGQRVTDAIQTILDVVDTQLWNRAPLVVQSNEIGATLALGFAKYKGLATHGNGSAVEIGFNFGINFNDKALVFDIYSSKESYLFGVVTFIGLYGKLGGYLAANNKKSEMKPYPGKTNYLPMLPFFEFENPNKFGGGLSGNFGLPPSPVADVFTYQNKSKPETILRIKISPFIIGFVRAKIGGKDMIVAVKDSVLDKVGRFNSYLRLKLKPNLCSRVFER